MRVVGVVARLQVQRSRLKPGPPTTRVYDASPLTEVEALEVGPRGCRGLVAGEWLLDVHHADHPDSRNVSLVNGLSLLPRSHYARMAARYGDHMAVGVAGESVLLETDGDLVVEDLAGELVLETADGDVVLGDALVASPCVEFCRFALGIAPGAVGDDVKEALVVLDAGTRGFYLTPRTTAAVRAGDRLVRR